MGYFGALPNLHTGSVHERLNINNKNIISLENMF